MKKSLLAVPLGLSLLFCQAQTAFGCMCSDVSVEQAFKESTAVFVGKVLKITQDKEASVVFAVRDCCKSGKKSESRWEKSVYKVQRVTLQVTESFKGLPAETVEIVSAIYNGGGTCGVLFKVGESYLVYATKRQSLTEYWQQVPSFRQEISNNFSLVMGLCSEADKFNERLPSLNTGICLRTTHIRWATEDLERIRKLAAKDANPSRIDPWNFLPARVRNSNSFERLVL
ncbi:MAG TPA: hypothetical protein VE863_15705 [Pyrinomonadaceae bacterium]|jgi:hypothetical protein|nr:hypothetical protein [Pyrinomonadaceae bacterium]